MFCYYMKMFSINFKLIMNYLKIHIFTIIHNGLQINAEHVVPSGEFHVTQRSTYLMLGR